MRGGRAIRGRRGRGRGDDMRNSNIVTRSSFEKTAPISKIEDLGGEITNELVSSGHEQTCSEEGETEPEQEEDENETQIREELANVKIQLEMLQTQLKYLGQPELPQTQSEVEKFGPENTIGTEKRDDFPALGGRTTPDRRNEGPIPALLPSWIDKVSTPKPQSGMPLKFIPPLIENGNQLVHIDAHDVVDLVHIWEQAVVVYVVGGNVSTNILRGYIRKHWSYVSMPIIHAHEDGYFILKFNTENECDEVLKGGPYFLNRAPMIVKKWSRNFNFKEEILRVILVWVRLPSLPLHCWGEEALSRIVSAVGVSVLADECTTKQLKVSYARVLVEVDITKEFVKEIRVRDKERSLCKRLSPNGVLSFAVNAIKLGMSVKKLVVPLKTSRKA
ncbi:unnamed protein product [Amaranthus hypochondriacus]